MVSISPTRDNPREFQLPCLTQSSPREISNQRLDRQDTDVPALVAAIVNARVAGLNAANAAKQKTSTSQLTAVGSLKSVMSLLQSALASLSDGTALAAVTAKADGKGITATAGKGATTGSYAIQVTNIATSQSITSDGFGARKRSVPAR